MPVGAFVRNAPRIAVPESEGIEGRRHHPLCVTVANWARCRVRGFSNRTQHLEHAIAGFAEELIQRHDGYPPNLAFVATRLTRELRVAFAQADAITWRVERSNRIAIWRHFVN